MVGVAAGSRATLGAPVVMNVVSNPLRSSALHITEGSAETVMAIRISISSRASDFVGDNLVVVAVHDDGSVGVSDRESRQHVVGARQVNHCVNVRTVATVEDGGPWRFGTNRNGFGRGAAPGKSQSPFRHPFG